jgi:hypothetical protein
MGVATQASATAIILKEKYKAAGIDYTGLAEYSDVSGYQNGTNDYEIKAHTNRTANCSGLKPSTRVWPRLDGRDLSNYCRMPGNAYGTKLITDANGDLEFNYKIPNDNDMKFRGLKHLLEVSDVAPPAGGSGNGVSSGKVGATTRCGQYLYFPSNKTGFKSSDIKQTSNISLTELAADSTKTTIVTTKVDAEFPDYMSQSFTVLKNDIDGVRVKFLDLYFSGRPGKSGAHMIVQIRETGKNGVPTDKVLAQSGKVFRNSVNVSSTASSATRFSFSNAIILKNNTTYALTLVPSEDDSDFTVWTARTNIRDINSNINAYFDPGVGRLYGSSSGNVWHELKNETLKMNLPALEYETESTTYFIVQNDELEFINISDIRPPYVTGTKGFQIDEQVMGESILTITYEPGHNASVGTVYQTAAARDGARVSDSNFANGTIRSVVSNDNINTAVVKLDAAGTFAYEAGANVYVGTTIVGTVAAFAANTCSGVTNFINTDFGRIRLGSSTADSSTENKFQAGDFIRGQDFGASAKIESVVNPTIDEIDVRVPFVSDHDTDLKWYIKSTKAGTVALASDWEEINGNRIVKFGKDRQVIYSRSNQSFKSLQIKGIMSTTNKNLSPSVVLDDLTLVAKRQRINATNANEVSPAGESAARYVSRTLRATNAKTGESSDRLIIHGSAYYPDGSSIYAYVRAKNDNDPEKLQDKDYTLLRGSASGRSVLGERNDKVNIVFAPVANTSGEQFLSQTNLLRMNSANSNVLSYRSSDGSVHHGIDDFQVKIVFTKPETSGTSYAPEIFDLDCIGHKTAIEIV